MGDFMCNEIPLNDEEIQFVKFLNHFQEYYKTVIDIAESEHTENFLRDKLRNSDFKMFSLDDICQSCTSFEDDDIKFYPRTTDAIFYKKHGDGSFRIYLVEFKGSKLCEITKKCDLVDVYNNLMDLNKQYQNQLSGPVNEIKRILYKFSDSLFNSLVSKPIETVTIAIPLIYEEYYEKNKDQEGVEHIDIRKFLEDSKIIYRVVSKSDETNNRHRARSNNYRCSFYSKKCKKYAEENRDFSMLYSYESNLLTYHKRYEAAGILFDTDCIEDVAFDRFINRNMK